MAQNVIINGVIYPEVPGINVPKNGGGVATFYDTAGADAVATDILTGKTAYGASGSIAGSMANNGSTGGTISTKGGSVTIPAGFTSGGTVSLTGVEDLIPTNVLSGKTILGVAGSLTTPTISQDSSTKILTIS